MSVMPLCPAPVSTPCPVPTPVLTHCTVLTRTLQYIQPILKTYVWNVQSENAVQLYFLLFIYPNLQTKMSINLKTAFKLNASLDWFKAGNTGNAEVWKKEHNNQSKLSLLIKTVKQKH